MILLEWLSLLAIAAGVIFFIAGTVGLLRFPDVHTRLHALTKADNLGLGFITLGVAIRMGDPWSIAKLLLIWMLAVLAAATVAQLVARTALERFPEEPAKSADR